MELNPSDESMIGGESQEAMAPADDEARNGAGFWESVKPVLIGFVIAAAVTGGGAAVVLYLIKGPKRKG